MARLAPPIANSYWVVEHRLLAGEFPGGGEGENIALRQLCEAGITEFIDLTHSYEREAYGKALPRDARHTRFAIIDTEIPEAVTQTRAILAHIAESMERGRNVYVHCRAGIGRTGLVIGCYLVEQGLGGKAALKLLNKLWKQSARSQQVPKVPQTADQADYIRNWSKLR